MRIAVFNSTNRVVGGAERYLAASLTRLEAMGHEVRLFCDEVEEATGSGRETVPVPTTSLPPLESLRKSPAIVFEDWKPHVACVHSQLLDPAIERAAMGGGAQQPVPAVYFAHAYAGACISGGKTLHDPGPRPCHRALGPFCLAHYYPHRCGGLDPRTMIRDYSRNRALLARLHNYSAIVTFSSYMSAEFVRNGVDASLLRLIPPFSPESRTDGVAAGPYLSSAGVNGGPLQIGFLGRFEADKGVGMLIRALPLVSRKLDRDIVTTLCGDGRRRGELQALASSVASANPRLRFDFRGWISREQVQELFASIHLLVVPSVWPEPFGLVGLEAAQHGLPTAAFAVGGITDWLIEGLNGHVANGDRPTIEGLAEAIIACLEDPNHHAELRRGAVDVSSRFSPEAHMRSLERMLGDLAMPAA